MRQKYQGRTKRGAVIIFTDDVIPFELPNTIRVLLYFLVSVALNVKENNKLANESLDCGSVAEWLGRQA